MFQRRLHIIILFIFAHTSTITIWAQDIVSTLPQNKTAVLEEFGGMYCVYCPEGHQILEELSTAVSDRLVKLNYHTGYYATPLGNDADLRSDFGEQIMEQTELTGFPAAAVNRKNYPGYEQSIFGSTALGRSDWATAVSETLMEISPVNIAAEASLNIATRELEVYIEYYYISDAPGATNRLNAAIVQNNILAPQHGGVQENYYAHQHVVRDFLTGQWGHIINNTNEGSFGSLTYNFTLPHDYRNVTVDPFNISLAIFIGEDQQNIFTGIEVTPGLHSTFSNDAALIAIYAPNDVCGESLNTSLLIRNDGNEMLESVDISYHIEGQNEEYFTWTGQLAPLEEVFIDLPIINLPASSGHHNFIANLSNPNASTDPTDFNNAKNHIFCIAPKTPVHELELAIRTDDFGYELYWEILNDEDIVLASGGNLIVGETNGGAQIATPSDPGAYTDNNFFIEYIELPIDGCYRLRVLDDFADGLCCEYGMGFFKLREMNYPPIIEGGMFGAKEERFFVIGQSVVATNSDILEEKTRLFPNPIKAGQALQISWSDTQLFQWQLRTYNGQLLKTGNQNSLPSTYQLSPGYYIFSFQTDEEKKAMPFVVIE